MADRLDTAKLTCQATIAVESRKSGNVYGLRTGLDSVLGPEVMTFKLRFWRTDGFSVTRCVKIDSRSLTLRVSGRAHHQKVLAGAGTDYEPASAFGKLPGANLAEFLFHRNLIDT